MRRYAYDTEFIESAGPGVIAPTIDLVSIGLVDIDNPHRSYYAVSAEFDVAEMLFRRPWLVEHVAPSLPWRWARAATRPHESGTHPDAVALRAAGLDYDHPAVKSRARIAAEVADFILTGAGAGPVQLWADHAAFDHVCLAWLYGPMIDLPAGIPMWTHDVQQYAEHVGCAATLPEQTEGLHNALADAGHTAERVRYCDQAADAARSEPAELRALFDMQWTRMGEATARWRAEDPQARALIMPDLGALLQWLMADADRGRAAVDKARHLNYPMVERLRRCAADNSPNWDGAVTVYPRETRDLVALIDHLLAEPPPAAEPGPGAARDTTDPDPR